MDIILYVNTSEKNRIGKTLTNTLTFSGTLRGETSVTAPVIMLEADDLTDFNYAYIPEFKRYYFISDVTSVRSGLWRVSLAVDVLESFKDEIKQLTVILRGTQTTGLNKYISGNVWKTNVKETTTIVNFSAGLKDSGEFILITAGG